MVNKAINLSAYQGTPPSDGSADRRIVGGPLYSVTDALALLGKGESALVAWTRKCADDLERLTLDIPDVQTLIREALQFGRYRNSEWCVQKPTGPWAACDAYQLERSEWVEAAHKNIIFEYYIKFAIGKTGKLLLVVSCHESQDRG